MTWSTLGQLLTKTLIECWPRIDHDVKCEMRVSIGIQQQMPLVYMFQESKNVHQLFYSSLANRQALFYHKIEWLVVNR